MDTKQLVNFCRPQVRHMQGELHETMGAKGSLPHMSALSALWRSLDAALNALDQIEEMLGIEAIKKQQMPLLAQEADQYFRQMVRDDE
jgi:hypothetical protein